MWEDAPTWKSPLDNGGGGDPPLTFDWRNRRAIREATRKRMKRKKLWNEAVSVHICFVSWRSLFSRKRITTRGGACWRTGKGEAERAGEQGASTWALQERREAAGSGEGHVCFSVSRHWLADVIADGGGQERRTGARCEVVSPAHLGEELRVNGRPPTRSHFSEKEFVLFWGARLVYRVACGLCEGEEELLARA